MATLTKPCPNCGQPMSSSSKICAHCHSQKSTFSGKKTDTCPNCGGLKSIRSKLCYACAKGKSHQTYIPKGHPRLGNADFKLEELDRDWVLSFIGLFVGEGSVQLTHRSKGLPTPVLQIHMRLDEEDLIRDIQTHIGGWISYKREASKPSMEGYISKPQIYWQTAGFQKVKPILELLISGSLPAKKVKEFHFLLEYINWRGTIGNFPSEEDKQKANWYFQSLRDMRFLKVQG